MSPSSPGTPSAQSRTTQIRTASGPSAAPSQAQTALGALGQTLRRWQLWLVLAGSGVLIAALVQFFGSQDQERYGLQSTELEGYGALAQTLQDQGVDIHPSRSAEETAELMEEHPQATLTVFEVGPPAPPQTVDELSEAEQDVVWLSPGAETLEGLFSDRAPELLPAPTQGIFDSPLSLTADPGDGLPSCGAASGRAAETLRARGAVFAGDLVSEDDVDPCFTLTAQLEPGGEDSGEITAAALLDTQHGTLFGSPAAFTNQHITTAGHAALALHLFGQNDQLIWYTPTGADLAEGGQEQWASPWDYMPDWVVPLTWWLLICTGVLILVQGRRHGPVISEPLPVEVPASESAEGRGRLYQSANATRESARALRSAHLLRAGRLLRLGPLPPEQTVIEAIARQTGRPHGRVAEELDAGHIDSNAALVRFAQGLLAQENELRAQLGLSPAVETAENTTPEHMTSENTLHETPYDTDEGNHR